MHINTLILGAGAAGMMCAAHAGADVLLVDHAKAPGEKIRISGGGRCNFTNMGTTPTQFLSHNPHFAKSALKRYTQWDFISLVAEHGIPYHEKTLGQLFCDTSAKDIVAMLRAEMEKVSAQLWLQTDVGEITKTESGFATVVTRDGKDTDVTCTNLVVATGGKSIPKMGATGRAYQIAKDFGLNIIEPRPGLVPLTFPDDRFKTLAGTATPARVTSGDVSFDEALLFTHRGLSGPAILQASSYWEEGQEITINLIPAADLFEHLRQSRAASPRKGLTTILSQVLPARLIEFLTEDLNLDGNIADQSDVRLQAICDALAAWPLLPSGSEGYRTAEVTLGGIDTDGLSSKTMGAQDVPGLYIIGEAVDVTGWLGGYNFQWAWSSGWAAGQAIQARG
jgi:predicted Rossmann fold flavoprotein